MTKIDAKTVKQLRDLTGAPMMDCKSALAETGGDVEQAIPIEVSRDSLGPRPHGHSHSTKRRRGAGLGDEDPGAVHKVGDPVVIQVHDIAKPWPLQPQICTAHAIGGGADLGSNGQPPESTTTDAIVNHLPEMGGSWQPEMSV